MQNHTPLPLPDAASAAAVPPERIDSAELLRGRNVLEIEHAGQRYVLRVTRENKLLLTK